MAIVAHRIRITPNNAQKSWLSRAAGAARWTYNWGLSRWKEMYATGKQPSWQKLNAELNARKASEFPWLARMPWKIANTALSNLGAAFQKFFQQSKKGVSVGYPKLKKKARTQDSFTIEGRSLMLDGYRLRIPKLGWMRMCEELRFPGKVLSGHFTKQADHWYVSLQVDIDESWVYPHSCETQAAVGVDLGVVDLAVLSTGEKIEAPRALRRHATKLRHLSKELSRRTKGGKNWQKTKTQLQRLHEHIANVRQDVTHKLTTRLVQNYRWIGVEELNVSGMARTKLAKSVLDAAMAEVRRQLLYKSKLAGATVVVANRWFPSSKTCSGCRAVYTNLRLSERSWTCSTCNAVHDRDVNAAINLKHLAEANSVTACCQGSSDALRDVKLPFGQESCSLDTL